MEDYLRKLNLACASYTRKKGVGLKVFQYQDGMNLRMTPFRQFCDCVNIEMNFSLSNPVYVLKIYEYRRLFNSIIHIIDDRISLLWPRNGNIKETENHANIIDTCILLYDELFYVKQLSKQLFTFLYEQYCQYLQNSSYKNSNDRQRIIKKFHPLLKFLKFLRFPLRENFRKLRSRIDKGIYYCIQELSWTLYSIILHRYSFVNVECQISFPSLKYNCNETDRTHSNMIKFPTRHQEGGNDYRSNLLMSSNHIDYDENPHENMSNDEQAYNSYRRYQMILSLLRMESIYALLPSAHTNSNMMLFSDATGIVKSTNDIFMDFIIKNISYPIFFKICKYCRKITLFRLLEVVINNTLETFIDYIFQHIQVIDETGVQYLYLQTEYLIKWIAKIKDDLLCSKLIINDEPWIKLNIILQILCNQNETLNNEILNSPVTMTIEDAGRTSFLYRIFQRYFSCRRSNSTNMERMTMERSPPEHITNQSLPRRPSLEDPTGQSAPNKIFNVNELPNVNPDAHDHIQALDSLSSPVPIWSHVPELVSADPSRIESESTKERDMKRTIPKKITMKKIATPERMNDIGISKGHEDSLIEGQNHRKESNLLQHLHSHQRSMQIKAEMTKQISLKRLKLLTDNEKLIWYQKANPFAPSRQSNGSVQYGTLRITNSFRKLRNKRKGTVGIIHQVDLNNL